MDGAVYIVGSKWAFIRVSITFETKEIQELGNKIMKERDWENNRREGPDRRENVGYLWKWKKRFIYGVVLRWWLQESYKRNTACEEEQTSITGEALPVVENGKTLWLKHWPTRKRGQSLWWKIRKTQSTKCEALTIVKMTKRGRWLQMEPVLMSSRALEWEVSVGISEKALQVGHCLWCRMREWWIKQSPW